MRGGKHLQPGWRLFQLAIFVGFLFANIYFEWGIEGIAAPVMGGMLAYYLTLIVLALRGDLPPVPKERQSPLHSADRQNSRPERLGS